MNPNMNALTATLTSLLLAASLSVFSQTMTDHQEMLLWPDGAPGALGTADEDKPSLTYYAALAEKATGAAVVICPGGGYGALAMDHEGRQIAEWFNKRGVSAFILKYRLGRNGYRHPAMLNDAQRAIRTVRARAGEWKIDPERIGIMGFSAGGHLASTAGTHFDHGRPDHADPIERASSRPTFMILGYPVVALNAPWTHRGSRENLLGKDPDPKLVDYLSNETQVTPMTPPTFLVHTDADQSVPPENSVMFYLALRKAGVPAEMHIYQRGRHGLGMLEKEDPIFATWGDRLNDWLMIQGVIPGS
jgi:acetyl esterase/lipase